MTLQIQKWYKQQSRRNEDVEGWRRGKSPEACIKVDLLQNGKVIDTKVVSNSE